MEWTNQEVGRVVRGECGVIPYVTHTLSYFKNSIPCYLLLTRLWLILGQQHNTQEAGMNFKS